MFRFIILFFLLGFTASLLSQNPHGADMKISCAACHNSAGWEIQPEAWQKFDVTKQVKSRTLGILMKTDTFKFHHGKTSFPLKGQHAVVDCKACHENLIFSEASSDCVSCHLDMHQQTVGLDCARCHTPANWMVDNISEMHVKTGFPLIGVHKSVSCEQCHASASALQFNPVGNDCINCHRKGFDDTKHPDHKAAGFPTDCKQCHNTLTPDWTTDKVDHGFFPLVKSHALDCASCHNGSDYSNASPSCVSCHLPDFEGAKSPNHIQANFGNDCASCHTLDPDWTPAAFADHDGKYFPIYSGAHKEKWTECKDCHQNSANYKEFTCTSCHINPETNDAHAGVNGYVYENSACLSCHPTGNTDVVFDHAKTNFPLTGAHINVDCNQCHTNGYAGTPTQCAACHTTDFNTAANPNHVNLNLSTDCKTCHTTQPGWAPANFPDHNSVYALNGAHAAIATECATCHKGDYNNTPNTCNGCHNADYASTTNPDHETSNFPTDCKACHTETAWTPSTFDHSTVYPFTGAHIAIANDCNACHKGDYNNTPNTCSGCHTGDYTAASNPNHVNLNIPNDCASCHTTQPGWQPAKFDIHNNYYALNGAHAAIASECATCHNGDYNNTPNTCNACHNADYVATTNPNHASAQFPTDCASCHSESAWQPANFNHDAQFFPIYSGTHKGEWTQCIDCHANPSNYAEITCTNCHINPETDVIHAGVGGYSYNSPVCLACHPTGEGDNVFNHNTTKFPLTGLHTNVNCIDCHGSGFQGTPTACAACHTPDYNATTDPNHSANQFPTECATCHTVNGWKPSTFDHNTIYPFNGAHANIANDCNACHNGNYTNTPNTCAGCHTPDYQATTNPNHASAQFPMECATCHSETAWKPSTFDHNSFYALNGAHASIANDCNKCHSNGFNNTPNTCAGCHTPDYQATTNPDHEVAQFPMECATCHSESAWQPSIFDHNTFYPLEGAHANIANDCNKCHSNGYTNTPNTCNGCHNADYAATTDPNHTVVQFPTDCINCHNQNAWEPANFDHDAQYFPIYSGKHNGQWSQCLDCHANPANYAEITCTNCHINPETDDAHGGVGGYSYNSPACLACHPNGDATNSFNHNNSAFPLTGAHIVVDCNSCHANGYAGTPTQCSACHLTDYNQTTNPNHGTLGFTDNCVSCHTTAPGWKPASFPNHNDYYALNGAHANIANDCAACHSGNYNNTPNTCAGCHTPDYNATTDPDHETANFPMECATCHSESAWSPSTFNHNSFYPLNGAHANITDCNACHSGGYSNTPNTCAGCHTPDYNATTDPDHQAANFPTTCATCHSETAWTPATFDHNAFYPLLGAHANIANDCNACHSGGYSNTPNTCAGCHTADYNSTTNPDHEAGQFPTTCTQCHTQTSWIPATFDHSTVYPFTGAHIPIANDCNACHNGNYNNTPNTCAGCHTPDYNSATNPNHNALNLSNNCVTCHTTNPGWAPALFPNHNNYYQLNGAHASIANDCAACHNGNYNNTPTTCFGCHAPDYNATTDPDHQAAQFPTNCASCHSETSWVPSTFDHDDFYPLTGAHVPIANDCNACHSGGYNNTPNTCAGCHTPDYNTSVNPNHVALGLSTNCVTCHTTQPDWQPALFPVHNNYWPLTGAHAAIANDCDACHNGNYNNTPTTCFGCHSADYNSANDPNHIAAGFPTTCQNCHNQTSWTPATFNHDQMYFPIYSGKHDDEWNTCADCHQNPNNYAIFQCINCHNDQNDLQDEHESVGGYQWNSNACYQCHPDGED